MQLNNGIISLEVNKMYLYVLDQKSFNKLNKEGFNIELTLVGSGEKYNELNNYIISMEKV